MSGSPVERLRAFSLFRGLDDDELHIISKIIRVREVDAGTVVFSEKDAGNELYLLDDGVVDISKALTIVTSRQDFGTKERSFVRLSGTDHCYFGEMALFGSRERSATVRAVTKCRLLAIGDGDFLAVCENNPRIGYIVMTNIALLLSGHLRRANEDILKLTTALSMALSG